MHGRVRNFYKKLLDRGEGSPGTCRDPFNTIAKRDGTPSQTRRYHVMLPSDTAMRGRRRGIQLLQSVFFIKQQAGDDRDGGESSTDYTPTSAYRQHGVMVCESDFLFREPTGRAVLQCNTNQTKEEVSEQ